MSMFLKSMDIYLSIKLVRLTWWTRHSSSVREPMHESNGEEGTDGGHEVRRTEPQPQEGKLVIDPHRGLR